MAAQLAQAVREPQIARGTPVVRAVTDAFAVPRLEIVMRVVVPVDVEQTRSRGVQCVQKK